MLQENFSEVSCFLKVCVSTPRKKTMTPVSFPQFLWVKLVSQEALRSAGTFGQTYIPPVPFILAPQRISNNPLSTQTVQLSFEPFYPRSSH